MSHEITIRADGTAEAAYALKPAWHGLGTVIDHAMNSEEAIRLAQLNWDVEQCPVYAHKVNEDAAGNIVPQYIEIPKQVANIRKDNGRVLGIVSERYALVQNQQAFDFTDGLHQDGIIKYEACGSLKGGQIVWLLARMPNEFQVAANDKLAQYILFSTAHDGTKAVNIRPVDIRVVCWNTWSAATGDEKGLSIKHRGNIMERLDEARGIITKVQKKFDAHHAAAEKLVKVSFNVTRLQALVEILLPKENNLNDTRRQHLREAIMLAFTDGPQNLPEIRGTAWAAFNAVTQVIDHCPIVSYKGKHNIDPISMRESRMESLMMGSNARFKESAFNLVCNAAEVGV